MYYEINVSWNGKHMFATHERSLRTLEQANMVFDEIVARFPNHEVNLLVRECKGEMLRTYRRES